MRPTESWISRLFAKCYCRGVISAAVLLLSGVGVVSASSSVVPGDEQIVASRGGVSVTLREIDARLMELPSAVRGDFFNDPNRIEDTINGLLTEKQLAAKAKDYGFEKGPYFETQIEQAKTRYIAARTRQMHDEKIETPDFSALAEERYLANPEKYATKASVNLTHVLVSTRGRTDAEAAARAEVVHARAIKGEDFSKLVAEFTDETRKGAPSDGVLSNVTAGVTVPDFEKAAFALKNPGDISPVVKTRFGYHVIRLDGRVAPVQSSFDAVRGQIVEQLRSTYMAQQKSSLLDEIRSMKTEANESLVASLRDRYTADGPKTTQAASAAGNDSRTKR